MVKAQVVKSKARSIGAGKPGKRTVTVMSLTGISPTIEVEAGKNGIFIMKALNHDHNLPFSYQILYCGNERIKPWTPLDMAKSTYHLVLALGPGHGEEWACQECKRFHCGMHRKWGIVDPEDGRRVCQHNYCCFSLPRAVDEITKCRHCNGVGILTLC